MILTKLSSSSPDNGITLNFPAKHTGQCRLKFPCESCENKEPFSERELSSFERFGFFL